MSACGRANPSFGMTPTFGGENFSKKERKKERKEKKEKKKLKFKKNLIIRFHTKRRTGKAKGAQPSCGMTTTQAIRDLFT